MNTEKRTIDDLLQAFDASTANDRKDQIDSATDGDDLATSFARFGTPVPRHGKWRKDAKEQAKHVAQADIEAVDHGETKGRMFKPNGKSGFIVTFRNGVKVMEVVAGQKDWGVDSRENLKALLRHFIRMCDLGELDHIFAAQAK